MPQKKFQSREDAIRRDLLRWYAKEARTLPFRGSKDPYRVWVSEIMLQQTRTETVGPYYTRFLARFPDVQALAAAPEQDVLKLWEGLGYYSRARNLHRAAKVVAQERGGIFPQTAEELQRLPGIGPYTAAAIASIAFDQPVPAIDGNLQRVLSRLYLVEEDIGMPSVKRRLFALGLALMPNKGAGDMNQALMDLGATICTPGTPDCAACPLRADCLALQHGEPERLPVMQRKKPPKEVAVRVLLLTHAGHILVQQRTQALLRGLYVFPLEAEDADLPRSLQLETLQPGLRSVGKAKHIFTHRVWHMDILHTEMPERHNISGMHWVDAEGLIDLPMPTAMRKAREVALSLLEQPSGV